MPSLKDLRNRIDSVKSTRKITKAMQMVAAAKLRRAQEEAENARPYTERFNAVMAGLVGQRDWPADRDQGFSPGPAGMRYIFWWCMTAERGLCGGFNSSIVKLAKAKAPRS